MEKGRAIRHLGSQRSREVQTVAKQGRRTMSDCAGLVLSRNRNDEWTVE